MSLHNQPFMAEHAVYVQQNFDQGKVFIAGPFDDHSGGTVILNAEDEKEALHFAQNDPAVKNGIFEYTLKLWNERINSYEGKNPGYGQEYIDFKHKVRKELEIT